MARVKNAGIRISGIACAVPNDHIDIHELGSPYFADDFIEKIHKNVGAKNYYFTSDEQCSGDIGIAAAEELLSSAGVDRGSIDGLIFNSQTPDYVVPPTSCRVQEALCLPRGCFTMDSNYGCAGYVQCVMIAFQLIQTGLSGKVLVINAECHHKITSRTDPDTALIFADGASATLIEKDDGAGEAFYQTLVDGKYVENLVLGNFKKPSNPAISDFEHSFMDGETLSKFMFKEIPPFVKELLEFGGIGAERIDTFLFHQANAYMIRFLARRMKLPLEKVPTNIGSFGNTSSPSIPLLICEKTPELFGAGSKGGKALLLSYGAGYNIAGAVLDIGGLAGGRIVKV
ncbi:MAG: ketoacyl-ACP synthase III [Clostridiales Family XIII bacterium]|nr:ketoacyl-ACP synthase III [Clostridiales Family XIII bacterium]